MPVEVVQLPQGPLLTNCYVVREAGEVLVIDPAWDASEILEAVGGRPVRYILLTHAHFDHIRALGPVREATGAPVLIHRREAEWLIKPELNRSRFHPELGPPVAWPGADRLLNDGEVLPFAGQAIRVVHTPGHSPGGLCYLLGEGCFCGDTLFAGSVGRTDLPGGSWDQLVQSIRDRLLPLPPATALYPGHGPLTTLRDELAENPFVRAIRQG